MKTPTQQIFKPQSAARHLDCNIATLFKLTDNLRAFDCGRRAYKLEDLNAFIDSMPSGTRDLPPLASPPGAQILIASQSLPPVWMIHTAIGGTRQKSPVAGRKTKNRDSQRRYSGTATTSDSLSDSKG